MTSLFSSRFFSQVDLQHTTILTAAEEDVGRVWLHCQLLEEGEKREEELEEEAGVEGRGGRL